MSFICEFCNKNLSTQQNIHRHQSSSKSCIEIQKQLDVEIEIISFSCQYCNKPFTQCSSKNSHETICKNKNIFLLKIKEKELDDLKIKFQINKKELEYTKTKVKDIKSLEYKLEKYKLRLITQDEIKKLEKKNNKLEAKLESAELLIDKQNIFINAKEERSHDITKELTKKGTTIYNKTTFNGCLAINNAAIEEIKNTYTIYDYRKGTQGLSNWIYKNLLLSKDNKLLYVCNDINRKIFSFHDENKILVKDKNAELLIDTIKIGMKDKFLEMKSIQYTTAVEEDIADEETMDAISKNHTAVIEVKIVNMLVKSCK